MMHEKIWFSEEPFRKVNNEIPTINLTNDDLIRFIGEICNGNGFKGPIVVNRETYEVLEKIRMEEND